MPHQPSLATRKHRTQDDYPSGTSPEAIDRFGEFLDRSGFQEKGQAAFRTFIHEIATTLRDRGHEEIIRACDYALEAVYHRSNTPSEFRGDINAPHDYAVDSRSFYWTVCNTLRIPELQKYCEQN